MGNYTKDIVLKSLLFAFLFLQFVSFLVLRQKNLNQKQDDFNVDIFKSISIYENKDLSLNEFLNKYDLEEIKSDIGQSSLVQKHPSWHLYKFKAKDSDLGKKVFIHTDLNNVILDVYEKENGIFKKLSPARFSYKLKKFRLKKNNTILIKSLDNHPINKNFIITRDSKAVTRSELFKKVSVFLIIGLFLGLLTYDFMILSFANYWHTSAYMVSLAFNLLLVVLDVGFPLYYLFPDKAQSILASSNVLRPLVAVGFIITTYYLLELEKKRSFLRYFMQFQIFLHLFLFAYGLTGKQASILVTEILEPVLIVAAITLIYCGYYAVKHKVDNAVELLVANFLIVGATIPVFLINFGLLEASFYIGISILLMYLLQAVLLGRTITGKIKRLKEDLIASEKEKRAFRDK